MGTRHELRDAHLLCRHSNCNRGLQSNLTHAWNGRLRKHAANSPRKRLSRDLLESGFRDMPMRSAPRDTFTLLLYVLSSNKHQHTTFRAYQRAVFMTAFGMRRNGLLNITDRLVSYSHH